jgi:hypothetical protein
MKKLAAVCLFLLLGAYALSSQNLPVIRIVNNTGYPIYFIYISPASEDEIGDDLLGEDNLLENGQTFTYRLPQPLNKTSVYDIILEDEEGDYYIKWGVTVTNNARIVFTMDDLEEE